MSLPQFTPPQSPEVGSLVKTQARANIAQFGDGYSQRGSDGLNAIKHTASLQWTMLSETDADAIEGFLAARKGYEAFLYSIPETTGVRKWICGSWNRSPQSFGLSTVSAEFEEVFDL